MQLFQEFDKVHLNVTICYYVGNLAVDSWGNNKKSNILRNLAIRALQLSTGTWRTTGTASDPVGLLVEGSGEFELKQKKLENGNYAYLAKRIKIQKRYSIRAEQIKYI